MIGLFTTRSGPDGRLWWPVFFWGLALWGWWNWWRSVVEFTDALWKYQRENPLADDVKYPAHLNTHFRWSLFRLVYAFGMSVFAVVVTIVEWW